MDVAPAPADYDRRLALAADGFLSFADACEWLTLGETEVRALLDAGTIAEARHGKRRLVSKRSLVEFGASRMNMPADPGGDRG